MPHFTRFITAGLLLLATLLGPGQAEASSLTDYEPGQVVVKLDPALDGAIDLINSAYGTTTLDSLDYHDDIFLLQANAGVDVAALAELMAGDPRLKWAELNYFMDSPETGSTDRIYGFGGYDDTEYHGQDATRNLQLEEVAGYSRGAGTLVAVLDTGVQSDHPELAGALSPLGFDFIDGDPFPEDEAAGLDADGDGQIDEGYGHGTHVAGIVHLIALEASILPVRVLNSEGRGNDFRTANAILYAAYQGADVINLSLGTLHPSALLRDTVKEAAGVGAIVVAAAGNLNSQSKQYPAADGCAIAVSAVNNQSKKASFANFGDWVDLAAPGVDIYSTFPVGGYAWWSGTSMSTPFVAGQAALLRSVDPQMSLMETGLLLGGTSVSLDQRNPSYQGLLGQGEIDPLASLEAQAVGNQPSAERNVLADCDP